MLNEKQRDQIEARLDNWRKTLTEYATVSSSHSYCAAWAKRYYQAKFDREMQIAIERDLNITLRSTSLYYDADEIDGWLVNAAVENMAFHDQRELLKMVYVKRWPRDWVINRMRRIYPRFNHTSYGLVKARALRNIYDMLATLKNPIKIRTNHNLQAGMFRASDQSSP